MKINVIKIIIFCIVISIFMCGCLKLWYGNRPSDQPSTYWISENGSFAIRVGEDQLAEIEFKNPNGEILNLAFNSMAECIFIEEKGDLSGYVEKWEGNFNQEDRFIITVKETTYFEIGSKITFYRVSKSVYDIILEQIRKR